MDLDFLALVEQENEVIHQYRDKKYQSIVAGSERIRVFGHARFSGPAATSSTRIREANWRRELGHRMAESPPIMLYMASLAR